MDAKNKKKMPRDTIFILRHFPHMRLTHMRVKFNIAEVLSFRNWDS